jgi:inosine-uridine nucleoside N-ribohydrolase
MRASAWALYLKIAPRITPDVEGAMQPVIFDLDLGVEDALALCLAVRSTELDILGVSVVSGTEPAETGAHEALQILELLRRDDIPVYVGSGLPLSGPARKLPEHHRRPVALSGPEPEMLPAGESPDLLIHSIEARPGEVVLICTGPVTNLACAERLHPGILRRARRIFFAGDVACSARDGGKSPDFNISVDPTAFALILRSGANITLVPESVGNRVILSSEQLCAVTAGADPVADLIRGWMNSDSVVAAEAGLSLHEALTVALEIHPDLCELETVSAGAGEQVAEADSLVADTIQVERAISVDAKRLQEMVVKRLLSAAGAA